MSAAPATFPTQFRAACHTPLSYFERALDLEYTQLLCFGLIIVETIGANPSRPSAEISYAQFAEAFRVSKDWVSAALSSLEQSGYITINRYHKNVATYSIREEYTKEVKGAGRTKIKGKCPDCQAVGLFSTEFIPTPHIALRKLGGCVNSATFRCVMSVIRYTCYWDREQRCIGVKPTELCLEDFVRLTALDKREITNGLTEAVKLGLIGRELRPGKPSLFWAKPEVIGALERKQPREVTPSQGGGIREAKPEASENTQIADKQPTTHENESGPYFFGRCDNCGHLVTVEPVSEEEFSLIMAEKEKREPDRPPRAGPTRAGTAKPTKWEATKKSIWEMFVAK